MSPIFGDGSRRSGNGKITGIAVPVILCGGLMSAFLIASRSWSSPMAGPTHSSFGEQRAVPMPVGAWIRLEIPGQPGIVCFTYVDREAGFSAKGAVVEGEKYEKSEPEHFLQLTLRLPIPGAAWRPLEADEVRSLGQETPPKWVAEFYGPQPTVGSSWGTWREHPGLKGRFLPDYPDDLQVLVHDGGPRFSGNAPEAVWVRVIGADGETFRGQVLNRPHHLRSVSLHDEVKFTAASGAEFPLMLTDKYLAERGRWEIRPCGRCGLAELFDAPSDLIRATFPKLRPEEEMQMFSTRCPLCGGMLGVESKAAAGGP